MLYQTTHKVIHKHATYVANICRTMSKYELVVKYCEIVVYYVAIVISILLVFATGSAVVRSVLSPTITANVRAYSYLVQEHACERYSDKLKLAESAYDTADYKDIGLLAAYTSRNACNLLDIGIQTRDKASSAGSLIKGLLTWMSNPDNAIGAFASLCDILGSNWLEVSNRLNERYQYIRYICHMLRHWAPCYIGFHAGLLEISQTGIEAWLRP